MNKYAIFIVIGLFLFEGFSIAANREIIDCAKIENRNAWVSNGESFKHEAEHQNPADFALPAIAFIGTSALNYWCIQKSMNNKAFWAHTLLTSVIPLMNDYKVEKPEDLQKSLFKAMISSSSIGKIGLRTLAYSFFYKPCWKNVAYAAGVSLTVEALHNYYYTQLNKNFCKSMNDSNEHTKASDRYWYYKNILPSHKILNDYFFEATGNILLFAPLLYSKNEFSLCFLAPLCTANFFSFWHQSHLSAGGAE